MCHPELTMVKMQGLGEEMLMLVEPSDHDFDMLKGIQKGVDCEIDVKLLLDLLVGFTSKRN